MGAGRKDKWKKGESGLPVENIEAGPGEKLSRVGTRGGALLNQKNSICRDV